MKDTFNKFMILFLILSVWISVDAIAQEKRAGTNAASELLIPVGARYIAMGGASIATVSGVESIFWNPAGMATSDYTADVMFSHMTHIAGIDVNYAAMSLKFAGLGSFGFSIKALDIGDIPITTEFAPDGTGALLSPQFVTAGLTYSRALTDRISIGATLNIISETLDRVTAQGLGFDFGVQYRGLADIDGLSIAIALKNLGSGMQFSGSGLLRDAQPGGVDRGSSPLQVVAATDELPSFIVLGASYSMSLGETSSLELVSTFQDNNFEDDNVRFGAEYNYDDLFFVRGGYSLTPDAPTDGEIYGITLGAGFHHDFSQIGITVDYAYRNVDFFDASNIFSISLGF